MEEILGFLGFSLGASLGVGAVRTLADGSRPVVREVLKAGIRAWDALSNPPTSDGEAPAAEPTPPARRTGRRRGQPEKIIIAHE